MSTCPEPHPIALEVKLDQQRLFQKTVAICYGVRDTSAARLEYQRRVEFSFRAVRPLVWWGYLAEDAEHAETTATGVRFTVEIWQSGADSNALLLGVVASAGDQLHMNTIHIAYPTESDTSEIADGLRLITSPGAVAGVVMPPNKRLKLAAPRAQ